MHCSNKFIVKHWADHRGIRITGVRITGVRITGVRITEGPLYCVFVQLYVTSMALFRVTRAEYSDVDSQSLTVDDKRTVLHTYAFYYVLVCYCLL